MNKVKLTDYSHGAGCGCKISPAILDNILRNSGTKSDHPSLIIGNETRDDAAVYAIGQKKAIISTTDFFMPIVDDPFDFGGIASVNAISDVYAMGGKPLMAISILGWPVDKLSSRIAGNVLEGARGACSRAGIPLAGGHSIDTPEPIFGLAVTGMVDIENIKSNDHAIPDCELYLTKPLGIGILTTAQKQGKIAEYELKKAVEIMLTLNDIGQELGEIDEVKSMTDVTGFGLLGHLSEMCEASRVSAEIFYDRVPVIRGIESYVQLKTIPGGTYRNFESYGSKIAQLSEFQKMILCDPQTSGGLLVAVAPGGKEKFLKICRNRSLDLHPIGKIIEQRDKLIRVN